MDFNKSKSSSDNANRVLGNFGGTGRDSVEVLSDSFFGRSLSQSLSSVENSGRG